MKLALLADVHGNLQALDAVLNDLQARGGADETWLLGDVAALGPDPVGVLDRLTEIDNLRVIRGNTDRYLVTGERPYPSLDDARADPSLLPRLVQVAESFAWTKGMVTQGGWLEWLAALPLELRLTLPDGTRILGVHASPGEDDGEGIRETQSAIELQELLAGCDADLVLVGHTHRPFEATVETEAGPVRAVNFGPVSMHQTEEKRAIYTLIDADPTGYRLERHFVPYDRQKTIAELERFQHPGASFIASFLAD